MKEYKIKAKIYKKHTARYIKISKNQFRIMESLYIDGSYEKKYYDNNNKLRFTEHSGLLDFGKATLQKIIINAKKNISDKIDDTILLPENMPDAIDYEYIFHTHPSTPDIGSRIIDGILYEFPSVSDLYHFVEHYNEGFTQGSMIIAPEGLYIIKSIDSKKKIKLNDDKYEYLEDFFAKIQKKAIKKYANNFNLNKFYNVIIKDKIFINLINSEIKHLNLKIFYKPRELIDKEWIINDLYLKINPIE